MANETLTLAIKPREAGNSRDARRLRRAGQIPGVLYGLDQDPQSVSVAPADLRLVLISGQALFDVDIDGDKQPVLIKNTDRHPVRGDVTHVDFLRVDLNQPIEAIVPIELTGVEEAPGVINRGILDHQLREVTILALPTAIPESLVIDISWMDLGDTFLLNRISPPEGVTIVSEHRDEIAVVTLTASRGSVAAARAEAAAEGDAEAAADGDTAGEDA
ncbi:MAG: 50S ribosomal protein L25 [Solirubrobacteraceae bacterium]|nr:50S ribosomal protein L25 [Solirubrobacteraceae bacterium]